MSDRKVRLAQLLEQLLQGNNLNLLDSEWLINAWLANELQPVQTGAFLAAFRAKGVTGGELGTMAKSLRARCELPISLPSFPMVDTCGTGGDGADTFNISTAVAFLSAALGIKVAKHGNRSASGKVGSADVLESIGLKLDSSPQKIIEAISKTGVTFLFAPQWHSSLIELAPLRKTLGIRTIFNLIGPLVNPFKPKYQVLGVASEELLSPMAEALNVLDIEKAVVVHGSGGLDEASLQGLNHVCFIENGLIRKSTIDPVEMGLTIVDNNSLRGGDLNDNKKILIELLKGKGTRAQKEVVALNTALVMWSCGIENNLQFGVKAALDCLESGKAFNKLHDLKEFLN